MQNTAPVCLHSLERLICAKSNAADGKVHTSLIAKLASLGEIKVELKRCRTKAAVHDNFTTSFKGLGDGPLPEKATKGRSISNHAK